MNRWYGKITGSNQGLIIDETTGENIAVAYDPINTTLIAMAPRMLDELKDIALALDNGGLKRPSKWLCSINGIISEAEGNSND